jgi:hypothetical protein
MGHTFKRCKQPAMEAAGDDMETEQGFTGHSSGVGSGWEQPDAIGGSGQAEWESGNTEAQSFGGGAPVAVGGNAW